MLDKLCLLLGVQVEGGPELATKFSSLGVFFDSLAMLTNCALNQRNPSIEKVFRIARMLFRLFQSFFNNPTASLFGVPFHIFSSLITHNHPP